jgi:hypothetical protein
VLHKNADTAWIINDRCRSSNTITTDASQK